MNTTLHDAADIFERLRWTVMDTTYIWNIERFHFWKQILMTKKKKKAQEVFTFIYKAPN